MLNFDQLVFETEQLRGSDLEKYLAGFFTSVNYEDYQIDELCNENEKMDIYDMFHSGEDILVRALMILDKDPLCLEANYVNYLLNDEMMVDVWFNGLLNRSNEYHGFTDYGKVAYRKLLNVYSQFLLDIHNVTFAIKVMKVIKSLEGHYHKEDIGRLSYMYSLIEDDDDFYDLYLNEDFEEMIPYILLMVVLLKHEEDLKAREVFSDFLSQYEKGEYIDHIWELDGDVSDEATELRNAVDICFEEICSVPYFFSWCSDNKERKLRS